MDEADCMAELVKWMKLNGFATKSDTFIGLVSELGWQLHEREKRLHLELSMAESETRRLKLSLNSLREMITGVLG